MQNRQMEIRIRALGHSDGEAVARLAQLDSARLPEGPLFGAELGGRLLAAISLSTGQTVADPFHCTADLVELLRARAGQLNGNGSRRGLRERLRLLARGGARAALPASPPGAGGRLLVLSERKPG